MNLQATLRANVSAALAEDVGAADLTALLLPADATSHATVLCRDAAVLCGQDWFNEVFRQVDERCRVEWNVADGEWVAAGSILCHIYGPARALLTAERSALNFLQLLSATATITRGYVDAVGELPTKIMDTRKTLPGLRVAQKYAVRVGGGVNQRVGLYDGVLIKENHIFAAGGIRPVLEKAALVAGPGVNVQIEVETLAQLREALDAGARLILLDNMDLPTMRTAVQLAGTRAELEASGGVSLDAVRAIAETGVQRISIGRLTKDVAAVDLSMRVLD